MLRLSVTSKLDGIRSWSLQAIDTCPGSIAPDSGLVEVCQGCYATQGNYRYPNVKAPRIANRTDWEREDWVDDMVAALDNDRYFRWFDSGDMYSVGLAEKIAQVIERTPHCRHWIPTRMGKFTKFAEVIAKLEALPNCVVRHSGDDILRTAFIVGPIVKRISVVIADPTVPTTATLCEAYERGGKCSGCRACWDKTIPAIAYPAHGKKIVSIIAKTA